MVRAKTTLMQANRWFAVGQDFTQSRKVLSGWNAASLTMQGVSEGIKAGESLKAYDSSAVVPLKDAKRVYSPLLPTQQTLAG